MGPVIRQNVTPAWGISAEWFYFFLKKKKENQHLSNDKVGMFQSVPDLGIYTWEAFQIGRKLYLAKTCALNLDQNNFKKSGFFSKWWYFRSSSLCVYGSFTFNKEQIIPHRADRHPWGEPCVWWLTVLRPSFPEWASKTIVLSVLIHGRKNFPKKYRKMS